MRAELRTAQTRRLANQSLGCIAESRLANQLLGCTSAGGEGRDKTCCCGAHILFTMCTQESLTLADRFSWKLCVSLIINSWRRVRLKKCLLANRACSLEGLLVRSDLY